MSARETPARRSRMRWLLGLGVPLLLIAVVAWIGWDRLLRVEPPEEYASVEELFKYGSLGGERRAGIPYWVWKVLPDAFPYLMPADSGYTSFGFTWEEGRDVPLGLTRETIGFPRVSTNCALCHVSRYRTEPGAEPTFLLSGTNTVVDTQAYMNFLFDAVNEWRFNADTLLTYIEAETELDSVDRLIYRYILIPQTRKALREMQNRLAWWYRVPEVGPGRWIAFNDLKFYFAGQPQDRSVGNPDVPPLWNMQPRQDNGLMHWDGFSDDIRKSAQNAAIAGGAMEEDVPWDDLERIVDWWLHQPVPEYPADVDEELAERGSRIWARDCASCHEIGNPTAGRVIPIEEIGTDRERFDLVTPATVERYNEVAEEWYGWEEPQIQKTEGYVAVLLDGVWLRAPYLHNGSVPTIADLLEPPSERPVTFWRGYDLYDFERLGYVSHGPEAEAVGFFYDTRLRGNGNEGHLYGTDLPAESKRALIEYLKTL